jgi:uncharacterized membrane protein
MMRFLNFMLKNNIGNVTVVDRILEMVSLVLAVFLITLSVVFYFYLPEQVPVHFNVVGEADGWGSKRIALILSVFGIVVMAICSIAAYNYKMVNLPFRLNPENLSQQVTLIGRMMRILSVLCGLLFITILSMVAAPQWGIQSICSLLYLIIIVCLVVVLTIYVVLIYKRGR